MPKPFCHECKYYKLIPTYYPHPCLGCMNPQAEWYKCSVASNKTICKEFTPLYEYFCRDCQFLQVIDSTLEDWYLGCNNPKSDQYKCLVAHARAACSHITLKNELTSCIHCKFFSVEYDACRNATSPHYLYHVCRTYHIKIHGHGCCKFEPLKSKLSNDTRPITRLLMFID